MPTLSFLLRSLEWFSLNTWGACWLAQVPQKDTSRLSTCNHHLLPMVTGLSPGVQPRNVHPFLALWVLQEAPAPPP